MMLHLLIDILFDPLQIGLGNGKASVSRLPFKPGNPLFTEPAGRDAFNLLHKISHRFGSRFFVENTVWI